MKLRSILLSGTCLPLLAVLQAQTPGDATPPDAYVVTVTSSVSGSLLTQRTYRDGSRVIVDRFESAQSTGATASRSRSFYDLDNHTAMTWKFPDSAGGCSQSAISGDWGDPFANSASLTGPNAKAVGQEAIHGMTATVYESSMGAKGTMKTWVQDDTGLVFKAELTPPGGTPETILEVSDVSFRPPSTATFALPTNCMTATSTVVVRNTDSASASPAAPAVPVIYVGSPANQATAAVTAPVATQPAAPATTTTTATATAVAAAAQPAASNASNAGTPGAPPTNASTAAVARPQAPVPASAPAPTPTPVPVAPAPVQTAMVADSAVPVPTTAARPPAASAASAPTTAPATPSPVVPSTATTATAAMATAEPTTQPTAQPETATVASAPASDAAASAADQTVWAAGDPNNFSAATPGPGSNDGCSVVLRIVKAGTMEPIVSGVQVGVGSEAFAESLRQYQQGGASGANLLHGMYAVMPSVRDGMFRIGHAPAEFTLDTSFGAAGDVRSNVGLQCYAPETTLLLVVRNPARISDGTELFWVKSGPQATVSN